MSIPYSKMEILPFLNVNPTDIAVNRINLSFPR